MIPVSSREFVEYKDDDGMVFRFKPKSGTLENELWSVYDENSDQKAQRNRFDEFFNKILISPKDADYNSDEKVKIVKFWHDANRLAVEQKKS
jgi:vancomycin resistance protein YoaR